MTATGPSGRPIASVLFLCTGNATRSVLAGELLRLRRPDLTVATAGTLSVEGRPLGWRTRRAFEAIGVEPPAHRSTQASEAHLVTADVVVGLAPEHVQWVRREHPGLASRAVTLARLARLDQPPDRWLADARAGQVDLADWEEVVDPGGGEVDDFIACAREIVALIDAVAARL